MTAKKIMCLLPVLILVLAQPGYGWKMFSADTPDTGLLSNSFIDILYHEGTIWLASGDGLSYSTDGGQSWFTRTTETNPGLGSDEPSALFGRTGEIWVAGSHFEWYQGFNYPFGDGLSFSLDNGDFWETLTPAAASNFAQLVYDLTGDDGRIYAACFHGGMIVRHDPDTAWVHVFYSPADSLDWEADGWADLPSGRYYSCAYDTTHADTSMLYGGCARGINKFLYLPKRSKLGGDRIYDIVGVGDFIYLAHEGGISQTNAVLADTADPAVPLVIYTADEMHGLGANWVRKMTLLGGKLWAGVFNPADSSGMGLYYHDNPDQEWTVIGQSVSGPSDLWIKADTNLFEGFGGVYDFKTLEDSTQSVFYIAAGDSGAARSLDSGKTWTRFFVDPLDTDPTSPRNQVYSIDATPDSLFLGTKAGLVVASYVPPFTIDYDTLFTFPEDDSTGSFVTFVRHQDSDSASFGYVGLAPQTAVGNYATVFLYPDTFGVMQQFYMLYGTVDTTILYDIYITEGLSFLASSNGLFRSLNFPTVQEPWFVQLNVIDLDRGLTLEGFDYLSTDLINNKLFAGSTGGWAYNTELADWRIRIANTNPNKHDLAVAVTHANFGLPGDWVVALEVQEQNHDTGAVVWAACRSVPDTLDQITGVGFSTDYGDSWQMVLPNEQVWNFAFDDNDRTYAAASGGLFVADTPWTEWYRMDIIDPITQDTIAAETEVYAVEIADSVLWVGTELGLASRYLDPDSSWEITRVFKSTDSPDEVFAAPVPFSPLNNDGRLSVHYHVDQSADVTVEIYDFAMNLVRVLADNRPRFGGEDYHETWDGFNGRGDMVAVGIYHIKVSYSTGEVRWGRLAIIP
jgi:hypothetical protein